MEEAKQTRKLGKLELGFIVIVVIGLLGIAYYTWSSGRDKQAAISSYQECVEAGNPVMESFPEQCSAGGQTFVNQDSASNDSASTSDDL